MAAELPTPNETQQHFLLKGNAASADFNYRTWFFSIIASMFIHAAVLMWLGSIKWQSIDSVSGYQSPLTVFLLAAEPDKSPAVSEPAVGHAVRKKKAVTKDEIIMNDKASVLPSMNDRVIKTNAEHDKTNKTRVNKTINWRLVKQAMDNINTNNLSNEYQKNTLWLQSPSIMFGTVPGFIETIPDNKKMMLK